MRIPLTRLALAGVAATALPLGLAAPSAVAATSASVRMFDFCGPNGCTRAVGGTPFNSLGDNIRSDPSTSQAPIGFLPFGSTAVVICFTVGQTISGPGASNDPFWDRVIFNGTQGWIADAVLNTGGDIITQVDRCA